MSLNVEVLNGGETVKNIPHARYKITAKITVIVIYAEDGGTTRPRNFGNLSPSDTVASQCCENLRSLMTISLLGCDAVLLAELLWKFRRILLPLSSG